MKQIVLTVTIIGVFLGICSCVVNDHHSSSHSSYSEEEAYEREKERFQQVLDNASDEDLFIVFRYGIAHHYVPNFMVDPYHDMYVMCGVWKRSLMVYEQLQKRQRTDLLRLIYSDLDTLDEYVKYGHLTGEVYPDKKVEKTIISNAGTKNYLDAKMGDIEDTTSLLYQYFCTPYLSD